MHDLLDTHVRAKSCLEKRSEFAKDFDIKLVLKTIKKPQAISLVERVHQVILNISVIKNLDKKVFDYIYPRGENLASISWSIRTSYHHTIQATQSQSVFGREMIFNPTSVLDWQVITAEN